MKSSEAFVKILYGLNKLASGDYPNLEVSQVMYAANTEIKMWVREQLRGANQYKDSKEQSTRRVDDLQVLLTTKLLPGSMKDVHFETDVIPMDYLEFNRLTPYVSKNNCKQSIVSHPIEEGNSDNYLSDWDKQPSFDLEETWHTMLSNRFHVLHNNDFEVEECLLTYYKMPKYVEFEGGELPEGGIGSDMEWEFKDDICEILIKEIVSSLAASIESVNTYQINSIQADKAN